MSLKEPLPNGSPSRTRNLKQKKTDKQIQKTGGFPQVYGGQKKSGDFSPLFIVFIIEA